MILRWRSKAFSIAHVSRWREGLNGYRFTASEEAAAQAVLELAAGMIDEERFRALLEEEHAHDETGAFVAINEGMILYDARHVERRQFDDVGTGIRQTI